MINQPFFNQDPPMPLGTSCPGGTFYIIRPGDTLYSLANRFHTTVQAIVTANPGINPNALQVNQQICIPTAGPPLPGPCREGQIYVINAGDTYFSIARRFNISVDTLLRANPGINPDTLQVGQRICIPAIPTPTITCPGPTYTIRSGDTIYSIARTLGISGTNILAANPDIDPSALQVGQIICLPVGGASPCPSGTIYRVRAGDTLYGIARNFDVTLEHLLRANPGLSAMSVIYPGEALCIPIREI